MKVIKKENTIKVKRQYFYDINKGNSVNKKNSELVDVCTILRNVVLMRYQNFIRSRKKERFS